MGSPGKAWCHAMIKPVHFLANAARNLPGPVRPRHRRRGRGSGRSVPFVFAVSLHCRDGTSTPVVLSFGHRSRRKSLSDHGAAMAARSPALLGGVGSSLRRASRSVRGDPVLIPESIAAVRFSAAVAVAASGHGGLLHRSANGSEDICRPSLRRLCIWRGRPVTPAFPPTASSTSTLSSCRQWRCSCRGRVHAAQPAGTFLPRRALARLGVASEARRRRGNGTLLFMALLQCAQARTPRGSAGGHRVACLSLPDRPRLLLRQRTRRRVLPARWLSPIFHMRVRSPGYAEVVARVHLKSTAVHILVLLACALLHVRRGGGERHITLILLWSVASFADVAVPGQYWPHYFILLFPATCVLVGYLIAVATTPRWWTARPKLSTLGRAATDGVCLQSRGHLSATTPWSRQWRPRTCPAGRSERMAQELSPGDHCLRVQLSASHLLAGQAPVFQPNTFCRSTESAVPPRYGVRPRCASWQRCSPMNPRSLS